MDFTLKEFDSLQRILPDKSVLQVTQRSLLQNHQAVIAKAILFSLQILYLEALWYMLLPSKQRIPTTSYSYANLHSRRSHV